MCKQVEQARRSNPVIYFVMFMAVVFAAGLTYAAESMNPLDAAERMDKMGAMGILAFGFLTSLTCTAYLIKLQYGRMLQVIDKNTEAVQKVVDAIGKCDAKGK